VVLSHKGSQRSDHITVVGEWYYTTHFGDPTADGFDGLTAANWQDRKDLVSALLDAIPSSMLVLAPHYICLAEYHRR